MGRGPGRPRKTPEDIPELTNWEEEYVQFLDELGDGNVAVSIYRFPRSGNVMEWCDNSTIDQAPLDIIRENHGPGKYRLVFRGPTGLLGTKVVLIASPYSPNGKNPPINPRSDHQQMDYLREQMAQQQTLLLAMIQSQKAPDVGSLLQGIAALNSGTKQPSAVEMLTGVVGAIAALKPATDASQDHLKNFKLMLETAREFLPAERGEDTPWSVLREVGHKAVETFKEIQAPRAPAGERQAQAEFKSAPAPGPDPAMRDAGNVPQLTVRQWLERQLVFLKQKALAGKDPEAWIDYILDNGEEPGCASMIGALQQGVTWEQLLQFDQEIAQNPVLQSWFRRIYDGIREELANDDILDIAGSTGNAADVRSDAAASAHGQPISSDPEPSA